MKTIIGIDNGTSGSIAIISANGVIFEPVPTKKSLTGKSGKITTRIDVPVLSDLLVMSIGTLCMAYVERPFTGRFLNAVLPAQRSFEAVLIALEQLGIGYQVVDSKEWQKPMLGAVKGSANLKIASKAMGISLYPALKQAIEDHGDADSLLMAHHFAKLQQ